MATVAVQLVGSLLMAFAAYLVVARVIEHRHGHAGVIMSTELSPLRRLSGSSCLRRLVPAHAWRFAAVGGLLLFLAEVALLATSPFDPADPTVPDALRWWAGLLGALLAGMAFMRIVAKSACRVGSFSLLGGLFLVVTGGAAAWVASSTGTAAGYSVAELLAWWTAELGVALTLFGLLASGRGHWLLKLSVLMKGPAAPIGGAMTLLEIVLAVGRKRSRDLSPQLDPRGKLVWRRASFR